jgi:hypothetical protein
MQPLKRMMHQTHPLCYYTLQPFKKHDALTFTLSTYPELFKGWPEPSICSVYTVLLAHKTTHDTVYIYVPGQPNCYTSQPLKEHDASRELTLFILFTITVLFTLFTLFILFIITVHSVHHHCSFCSSSLLTLFTQPA